MKRNDLKESITIITELRRVSYGNIRHKPVDIIIIGLCTVICGGEDYNDMEAFGLEREEWLRTFLELPNGIPDSDTFRRLFERLNPAELSECLNNWLKVERAKRSVVAVDGKTIRGSGNTAHKAYHAVSAFSAENQITLGEIPAEIPSYETLEKDHGRLEKRTYYLLTERAWEYEWEKWTNLNGIGMVKTHVCEKDTVREDIRYYITSLTDVTEFAYVVRKHRSIENQFRRNLDVIFREDAARARKDNSPLNMNVLRKAALAPVNQAKYGRLSKKKMMFQAALNPQVLLDILFPPKK